ncbi:fungal trichothecene efflux pump [Microdochium bolleyi]|uniref:Fungal trichothecene efflux pump n=1 Tax=Microdochium bolleyi TaxID=196109 RepID=A0A136JCA9_9PEZI|nr:fungal trichothecene efflux pump [Microdochium bolleyi]
MAVIPLSDSSSQDGPRGSVEKQHDHVQHIEDERAQVYITEDGDGKLTRETVLAYIAMCGQINAYIMSMLIPATTLPTINAELGPDPNSTWITLTWTLGASILVSIGGRLSDIFGRRYFMMTGALISICGCLVGANGRSINQMIVSGVLFGIGSGFQELCYACVQECVPNRYRVMAVGGLDVSLALAFSSPVVAYAFIAYQPIGWRGAYWYLFSFHCFAFILLFLFYNPPDFEMKHRSDGKTKLQLLAQMDWVGVFLFTAGGVLFLVGINFGGRTYPWMSAGTIVPIVLGGCCFIVVGLWCTFMDLKYPLFPPKLFRRVREFDMVIVVCFVGGMLYYSMNVLWPRQSQAFFVPQNDIIMKGVYAIIFSCGTWTAGLITVFICSRLHHEKWQLVGFTVVQTALIASMASVGSGDKAQAIATVVLAATTITPPQLLSFTMLSFGLESQEDLGVAVGLAGTFRLFGGAVATAIYTAIYTNKSSQVLPSQLTAAISASNVPYSDSLLSALVKAAATNTAAAYNAVQGMTPELAANAMNAVRQSYVQGFRLVYLIAIAFGALAVMAAACTVSTDRSKKNNDRAVVMKNEVENRAGVQQRDEKVAI